MFLQEGAHGKYTSKVVDVQSQRRSVQFSHKSVTIAAETMWVFSDHISKLEWIQNDLKHDQNSNKCLFTMKFVHLKKLKTLQLGLNYQYVYIRMYMLIIC